MQTLKVDYLRDPYPFVFETMVAITGEPLTTIEDDKEVDDFFDDKELADFERKLESIYDLSFEQLTTKYGLNFCDEEIKRNKSSQPIKVVFANDRHLNKFMDQEQTLAILSEFCEYFNFID